MIAAAPPPPPPTSRDGLSMHELLVADLEACATRFYHTRASIAGAHEATIIRGRRAHVLDVARCES
jgi:hypothetical protein